MHKLFACALLCGFLAAQTPQTSQQQTAPPAQQGQTGQAAQAGQTPAAQDSDEYRIRVLRQAIQVPVWVYSRGGNYVNGLQPEQFRVFDNATEQKIASVDVAYTPISMVIVVQANADVEKMLPAINRIGNLIKPHILGDEGEAAVVAYDSRVRTLQDFTHDADQISAAMRKIQPGSNSQHLNDAIFDAVRMLRSRPAQRRRVILLIGERRDLGSEMRPREVVAALENSNVTLYSANMSVLISKLTAAPRDPRPPAIPPTAMPMPGIGTATPTTVMQTYGTQGDSADFLPLLVEIYRDAKAVFKANPVDIYTKGSGGEEFAYYRAHGLEQVIDDIGEVLHAQYMITYYPSDDVLKEAGFHQIQVDVLSKDVKYVRVKPGYYLGAK